MAELIGSILILVGAFFLFSAGPRHAAHAGCVYAHPGRHQGLDARQHAGARRPRRSITPDGALKLVIVIYFVLMTNPISSHALARAAHAIRRFR